MSKTGEMLTSLREERGWFQYELAKAAGLSRQYINDLEHGRRDAPPADVIDRLSDAMGADRVYLMTAKVLDVIGDNYEVMLKEKASRS